LIIAKHTFIPLLSGSPGKIRDRIGAVTQNIQGVATQDHGEHLGYYVSPGKGDRARSAALNEGEKQVQGWGWGPLGLCLSAAVCNTFIILILGFVAQQEMPPANVQDRIAKILRRAALAEATGAVLTTSCTSSDRHGMQGH
jgi:hypothetical protein